MIDLRTPLPLRTSFAFPVRTPQSRREVVVGAAWLLLPGIGWLMGRRVVMVHRMMAGEPAWPAWRRPGDARPVPCAAGAAARTGRGWGIALSALAPSFLGLLGLGVGFLATSVWFWQGAGFSFAGVFAQKYIQPAPASVPPAWLDFTKGLTTGGRLFIIGAPHRNRPKQGPKAPAGMGLTPSKQADIL
ncbi:MAG TPA: hypothetical protein VF142_21260 [Longimicrobium sp.]